MIENNEIIKVINRKNGSVGYTIPDLGITRTFRKGESKELTMEELRKLSWIPGGRTMLENYLLINNSEAIKELIGETEPEYNYTEEHIKTLLFDGSLEQLEDCLDYAPLGVIDLLKNMAVELKIDNVSKRKLIEAKTGFNITGAINIKEEIEKSQEEEDESKSHTINHRKATPITLGDNKDGKGRKAELPNYNVISTK